LKIGDSDAEELDNVTRSTMDITEEIHTDSEIGDAQQTSYRIKCAQIFEHCCDATRYRTGDDEDLVRFEAGTSEQVECSCGASAFLRWRLTSFFAPSLVFRRIPF
jgi:hypothetical protein